MQEDELVRPRWAVNTLFAYALGVVAMGVALGFLPVADAVAAWLPWVSALVVGLGSLGAVFAARCGSLHDPREARESGVECLATVKDFSTSGWSKGDASGGDDDQIVRIELEVAAPEGAYRVLCHRIVPGTMLPRLTVRSIVRVRIVAGRPDLVAFVDPTS